MSAPPRALARWGLAGLVLAVSVVVSLIAFATSRARERVARRLELERMSAQIARSASASFDVPLEVLRSVPAFFEASEDVTRAEFRSFVSGALARYPWIYAVEWIPRVPSAERARYEAAAVADGLAGFRFQQDAPAGPPVLAEPRAEYFPLYYMEPLNPVPLGLEETALPARRVALERARDLDATIITERLRLVQDDPSVTSVIAFHPIYRRGERPTTVDARRQSLRGFAAAVFRVRPVLEAALRDVDAERLDVALLDVDAAPPVVLYESRPGVGARAAQGALVWEQATPLAGRRWSVRVGDRDGWLAASSTGFGTLGLGLLASALAASLTYALQAAGRLRGQVRAARRLGQYTLVERLGAGGMGTVYRAHHALLRRPTALKVLRPGRADAAALSRFEAEVQLTAALTHPNTVVVYDYGRSPDGVFYYVMELLDGVTLQELVDVAGPQPPARVRHVLLQICGALAEAHGVGLVHRDVKPANVMLCRRGLVADFVKVLDFGLAKDLGDDAARDVSQSATFVGTPLYLAPELALRRPFDARVDVYALGAVAYFLLTGAPVFRGETAIEVCLKHLSAPPEPPSTRLAAPLPAPLEALVMRCLEKDPDDRPASVLELAAALSAIELPAWSEAEIRAWWAAHGEELERAVRAARAREGEPTDRSIDVDRRRFRGASDARIDAA